MQASNAVVTGSSGIVAYAYMLYDSDATHSFISTTSVRKHNMLYDLVKTMLYVEILVGSILSIDSIYKSSIVGVGDKKLFSNLTQLNI